MVNILTTRFNVQKFYVLPTQCIYILCTDVRTAIISLYNINWLVYPRRSVFTARYGLTTTVRIPVGYIGPCHGSGGYLLACHRGGARSIPVHSMWDLWWRKWHCDRFFFPSTSVFRSIIPPMLHTHLHQHAMLSRRTNGRSLGTFQKAMLFRKSGSMG